MSASATVPAPTQPQPPSAVTRVLQTIYAPTRAFAGLNGKTAWILPWVLISVVTIAFFVTVDKQIGFDKVVEYQLKLSSKQADQLERLPADQRDAQLEIRAKFTKYFGYAAPLTTAIMYTVLALLLWGTFTFACGVRMTFGTTFSVLMLGNVPGLLKTPLAILAIFAGVDPDGFNINNPLATNLSVLFDPFSSRVLYTFGAFIDVFMIWTLIVVAIGFSAVSKVKRSTAMIVVFGWFTVTVLIFTGLAAIS